MPVNISIDLSENKKRMLAGELYHAFTSDLVQERQRCAHACHRYNTAGEVSRRQLVELWREVQDDHTPLPPPATSQEEDDNLFDDDPWIEAPIRIDYGTLPHLHIGSNVYINANCHIIDTCPITIGSRTLIGPNVSFFSGTHPLDPALRNGTRGPESGKAVMIGEDCWIGGNAVILPGVVVGRGATIGAGSVVTKNVEAFTVVAGNPARMIKRIVTSMNPKQNTKGINENQLKGAEKPMTEMAL
ncbi:MAG: hypothetical protein M1834_006817 [Cirrosporium novae-zelandiae]|nr:MAG: hypothetical protein M1834_006817 [Cirrosporium novae-zelandiae]